MNYVLVNLLDNKNIESQQLLNLDSIIAIDLKSSNGKNGDCCRLIVPAISSTTPPKKDDKYPRSYHELASLKCSTEQGQAIYSYLQTLKAIPNISLTDDSIAEQFPSNHTDEAPF